MTKKVKGQPTECEKVSENHTLGKTFMPRIYIELYQPTQQQKI